MTQYDGNWERVIRHVVVKRLILSEKDRVGIGTFQPKDEKNQDSTELTGDLNYRKIAEYGSDSDPRAFNFDGELNIANRGLIEFIEILKLDVAFLYDLLGASQEHKIKPKKFPQTDIDEVILGHTNEPEYRKLQNNELMEAFRDRTVKIDIPYNTVWQEEVKIYARDFNDRQITGKHIAPHTIEMAAMWAVLTRLEEPKKAQITLLQKLKLYGGQDACPASPRTTSRSSARRRPREGMDGISPRYIQDKISNALVRDDTGACVNPFMVLNELESGPAPPQPHHPRGDAQALPRAARHGEAGVRGRRQERGPEGDLRRRGGHRAPVRQLRGQHQGLHLPREGAQQVHRARRTTPTSGSCARSRRRSTSRRAARTTSGARS